MNYRQLGKSGAQVSELSFGAWVTFGNQADVDLAAQLIKTAYDGGVNFFDNAEIYERGQAEIVMGDAIKKLGLRRDSYLVSSKVHGGRIYKWSEVGSWTSWINVWPILQAKRSQISAEIAALTDSNNVEKR